MTHKTDGPLAVEVIADNSGKYVGNALRFDTVDEAWAWKDRILARAAIDPPDMPPQGGTTDDDRTLLTWWLTCAEEGT